jgi:hypothetical protein
VRLFQNVRFWNSLIEKYEKQTAGGVENAVKTAFPDYGAVDFTRYLCPADDVKLWCSQLF